MLDPCYAELLFTRTGGVGSLYTRRQESIRTTVRVVTDPEQPGVQYRCSRLRASATSEASLLGSVARACRRSRQTLAVFAQCLAASRWRDCWRPGPRAPAPAARAPSACPGARARRWPAARLARSH